MDFQQTAKFFDQQNFDRYNFTTSSWNLNAFKGQLKRGDEFVTIWNRPTRKRMLYVASGVSTGEVIRVPHTGEVFMVGHASGDVHANVHYRSLVGLHQSAGVAVQRRKTPVESLGVKGWAAETVVKTTFGDVELRSVNEGQEAQLINYGNYFMFLPVNTVLHRHDTVTLNSVVYYVLEVYPDSGLMCARVSAQPDERVNFVYTSVAAQTYNTASQTVTAGADTNYNVTGKVVPLVFEDLKNSDVFRNRVKVMILTSFISFTPKMLDKLTYLGVTYTVEVVQRDAGLEEWQILASA